MTSLDDISYKLGELNSGQETLFRRQDKQDIDLSAIRGLLNNIDAKLTPVVDAVAEMKPHVTHYAGVRKQAGWLHSIIVGVASICGGSVTAYLFKKFGG